MPMFSNKHMVLFVCLLFGIAVIVSFKTQVSIERKTMKNKNKISSKISRWINDITKKIPLGTSGKLKTKDKKNKDIILEWKLSHVKDPNFAKYMKDLRDIGVQGFVPVEVDFLKSNLNKNTHKEYCNKLERIFDSSPKANDWKIFKKALDINDWDTVEEKMELIIEEFFLMDYSNFGTSDLHLFVIIRDEKTNKVNGYAMFYVTPEYNYGDVKMTHLGVVPELRCQGIGRILMSSVLRIIPSVSRIFQNPRPSNKIAISAYVSCGFFIDKNPVFESYMNPDHWIYLEYKTGKSHKLQDIASTLETYI